MSQTTLPKTTSIKHIASESAVILNDMEFIIAGDIGEGGDKDLNALYKYNTLREEWTRFLSFNLRYGAPDEYVDDSDLYISMEIHRGLNQLFILCSFWSEMHDDFVLDTSVLDIRNDTVVHRLCSLRADRQAKIVHVNGVMHKVGNSHSIWNEDTLHWESIKTLPGFMDPNLDVGSLCEFSLVHVPSKDIVLRMGGYSCFWNPPAGIWQYSVASGIWKEMKDEDNNSFRLMSGAPQAVLSSNEQFVIICAPCSPAVKRFLVLDIRDDDQYKLWDSSVKRPELTLMTKTGGQSEISLLIFGWIRKQDDLQFVPRAIKTLITHWLCVEMIHCVTGVWDPEPRHKMIAVMDILRPAAPAL